MLIVLLPLAVIQLFKLLDSGKLNTHTHTICVELSMLSQLGDTYTKTKIKQNNNQQNDWKNKKIQQNKWKIPLE